MKHFVPIFSTIVLGGAAFCLPSCTKQLACGPGTVERNGECVAGGTSVTNCGDGGTLIAGTCYPIICGSMTTFDPLTGTCIGTGGASSGCSTSCSAPGVQTMCVTGNAKMFVDQSTVMPTAMSHAKVRVYDPIEFATNPGAQPKATVDVEMDGCYIADGVPRFSSNLVAVSVDDDDMPGPTGVYAIMGAGSPIVANRNVTGLIALGLTNAQAADWQTQIGATNPPGCAMGLEACGGWIGAFLDRNGAPVTNVRPSRPGNDPPIGNVFCFGADRGHLDPNQKTTTSVGMCMISPDDVETHTGVCGTGGCMCGTMPCTPSFAQALGGTAPGVFFYQPFTSTM